MARPSSLSLLLILLVIALIFVFNIGASSINDGNKAAPEKPVNQNDTLNIRRNRTARAVFYPRSKGAYRSQPVRGPPLKAPPPQRWSGGQGTAGYAGMGHSPGGWSRPTYAGSAQPAGGAGYMMRKTPGNNYLPYGAGPGRPQQPGGGAYMAGHGGPRQQYFAPSASYPQQNRGPASSQQFYKQPSYAPVMSPPQQQTNQGYAMMPPSQPQSPVFSGPVVMQPDNDVDDGMEDMGPPMQYRPAPPGYYQAPAPPPSNWMPQQKMISPPQPANYANYAPQPPQDSNVMYQQPQQPQQPYYSGNSNNNVNSQRQIMSAPSQGNYLPSPGQMPAQPQQPQAQPQSQQQQQYVQQPSFSYAGQQSLSQQSAQSNQLQYQPVDQSNQIPKRLPPVPDQSPRPSNHLLDVNGQSQVGVNQQQYQAPPQQQVQQMQQQQQQVELPPPLPQQISPQQQPQPQPQQQQNPQHHSQAYAVQQPQQQIPSPVPPPPMSPQIQTQSQAQSSQSQNQYQPQTQFQQQQQAISQEAQQISIPTQQQIDQQEILHQQKIALQVQEIISQLQKQQQQTPPTTQIPQTVFQFQGAKLVENQQTKPAPLQPPAPQKSVQEAVQQALLMQHQQTQEMPPEPNRKSFWQQQIQQALQQQQQKQNTTSGQEDFRAIAVQAVSEYGRRIDDSTEPVLVEGLLLPENRRLVKCGEKKFVSTQTKLPNIRCCGTRAFNTAKLACLKGHIVDERIWQEAFTSGRFIISSTTTSTTTAPHLANNYDSYRQLAIAFGQSVSDEQHAKKAVGVGSINEARVVNLNRDELRRRLLETMENADDNEDGEYDQETPSTSQLMNNYTNYKQEMENDAVIQMDFSKHQPFRPHEPPEHRSNLVLDPVVIPSEVSIERPKQVDEPSSSAETVLMEVLRNEGRDTLSKNDLLELFKKFQESLQQQKGRPPVTQADQMVTPPMVESSNLPNGTFTLRCGEQSWLTREPPSLFLCCGDILNRLGRISCEHGKQTKPPLLVNYDESDRGRKLPKGVALAITDAPPLIAPPIPPPVMPELLPGEPEQDGSLLQQQLQSLNDDDLPPPLLAKARSALINAFFKNSSGDSDKSKSQTTKTPAMCEASDVFCCGKFVYKKQTGQVCCEGNYGISEAGQMDCCGPIPFNVKTHACSESSYVVLKR